MAVSLTKDFSFKLLCDFWRHNGDNLTEISILLSKVLGNERKCHNRKSKDSSMKIKCVGN